MTIGEITRRRLLKGFGAVGAAGAAGMLAAPSQLRPARAARRQGESRAPACPGDWTPTYPTGFTKFDPPVQLSSPWGADIQLVEGDSLTDNPMYNRLRDNLGIEYTVAWQASGEVAEQRMEQAIVGGELPDVFLAGATDLADLIQNEAVENIQEIWEATASPLVKEKREYPDGRHWVQTVREDGLYGVPFTYGPAYNIDNLGHVRQDFLDKIGAPVPQTLDELTEVLRAFVGQGLSQWGIGACQNLITYFQSLDPVFGSFGVMPGIWLADPEGKLAFGSIQPGIKDALGVLAGWYQEKLIDPDFFTKTEQDAEASVNAGQVGAFFGPWWSATVTLIPFEQATPGATFTTMPAPTGPGGLAGRKATAIIQDAVVFRAGLSQQQIEAAITQLNWSTELHVNWQQYQQYGEWRNSSAFIEGYEYILQDCQLARGPVDNQYIYLDAVGFNFPALSYATYQSDVFRDIVAWRDRPAGELNLPEQFLLADPIVNREADLYLAAADSASVGIQDQYLGNPTERMIDVLPDLIELELEVFTEIIIGQRSLDEFDAFVAEWRSSGGDEITEEVNAWKVAQGA